MANCQFASKCWIFKAQLFTPNAGDFAAWCIVVSIAFQRFTNLFRGKKGPIVEAVPSSPPQQQGVWTSMGKPASPSPEGANLSNSAPEIIPPNKPRQVNIAFYENMQQQYQNKFNLFQELDKPPSSTKTTPNKSSPIGWENSNYAPESKSTPTAPPTSSAPSSSILFGFNGYEGTQRKSSPDVWNVGIPLWSPTTPVAPPTVSTQVTDEVDQDYEWSDTAVGLVDLLLSDRFN